MVLSAVALVFMNSKVLGRTIIGIICHVSSGCSFQFYSLKKETVSKLLSRFFERSENRNAVYSDYILSILQKSRRY